MKIHGTLTPFMHGLFQQNPEITTPEAVAEIRDFLATHEDGEQHVEEAAEIGFASVWGGFTGELRRKAQKLIRSAALDVTPNGLTITVFENMKLPLPDADISPTYADSTALMLRQSIAFMTKQVEGLEQQIGMARKLAAVLESTAETTGDTDLTLRAAFARGLITFAMVEAA